MFALVQSSLTAILHLLCLYWENVTFCAFSFLQKRYKSEQHYEVFLQTTCFSTGTNFHP
jgi:hypothetical protein